MRTFVVTAGLCAWAASASAQTLTLEFRDGRVSIDAANVPVRTILSEWARLGSTKVVGGERVSGAPLTIKLDRVPEAQALEIVLRNVAGYMAAPRSADAAGASAYDRILVMPTSSAPAAAASAGNRPGGTPTANPRARAFGPQPSQNLDPEPEAPVADTSDTGVNEPPFQFPQQNPFQGAVGQPGPFGTPMAPGGQPPVFQFGPGASGGVSVNPSPQQPAPVMQFPGMAPSGVPANTGGFGIGSPTPGVILQPAQPGQPPRPPGGQ